METEKKTNRAVQSVYSINGFDQVLRHQDGPHLLASLLQTVSVIGYIQEELPEMEHHLEDERQRLGRLEQQRRELEAKVRAILEEVAHA